MRDWRVKFEHTKSGYTIPAGWVIYYRGARMWKKPTLEEALSYVERYGAGTPRRHP